MHSRAHLIIEREINDIKEKKPRGIYVEPIRDDSLFEISAELRGDKNGTWDGGIFRIYIRFSEHYNQKPPHVSFHTIPFHPNVDVVRGKPSLSFLEEETLWNPNEHNLMVILTSLQYLLDNPDLERIANPQAAELLEYAPQSYFKMVKECVSTSQKLMGLKDALEINSTLVGPPKKQQVEIIREPGAIQPTEEVAKLALLEALENDPTMQCIHLGVTLDRLRQELEENERNKPTVTSKPPNAKKSSRLKQVNKMKRIYLQGATKQKYHINEYSSGEEEFEEEVNNLVEWTEGLDEEAL
ncbi:DgyrCDS1619 [Dimorphilus gyrociliatus]|uniref:DgyrCDS1619 n=1 Tax=Dimorphilus gyrociliatus TaxID=2664684 RepID=A0A7I8V7Y1_9ANNE|nr:DgyrCDS1619 [Dimorphilus gyrociliatus]